VQITCFDRNGKEVKRVTSTDDGTVEDNETTQPADTGSTTTGGNGGSTTNTGGGSTDPAPNPDPDGGSNSDE